jgi:hypothetical protein
MEVGTASTTLAEQAALKRRHSNHHRSLGPLEELFQTDSYAAHRGAEQVFKQRSASAGTGADQIEAVGPRNKRKDDYFDCAFHHGVF